MKIYFFTCSYFRVLYSVLHLKNSSNINSRKNFDDLPSIYTLSAPRLRTTTQFLESRAKFSFLITWRVLPPQWRNNSLHVLERDRKKYRKKTNKQTKKVVDYICSIFRFATQMTFNEGYKRKIAPVEGLCCKPKLGQIYFTTLYLFSFFIFSITLPAVMIILLF